MGQTMQDLKKKGESAGREQEEKMKGETQSKGSEMAQGKAEEAKKKAKI